MAFLPYLLSGVAALAIGAVYYHPKVFGTMWMKASGMTEEKMQNSNMAVIFGLAFLFAMMISLFLDNYMTEHLAHHLSQNEGWEPSSGAFGHGAAHGLFLGVFLALPIIGTISLFERRNFKYVLSHVLYWMITLAVITGIVSAM